MSDAPAEGRAPSTGSSSARDTELAPEEQPVVTGALFLCMVMLLLIAGAWAVMFYRLAER